MRLKLLLAATAIGAGLAPALALAQDTGANNTMGEVIVTARKRQESILNVPVVETALPQAQLERFQFQDLRDLNARVPGLQIGQSNLSVGTQVSLRGIGTNTLNAGVDQSVSLNIDGLQLTQGLAYASAMFDLGQVEVLRGPQALFYGKNSPGGVISVRTADPTDRVEVIGRYGHEIEAAEDRFELILSGPVNDQLKLRLATLFDRSDGYFENEGFATPGLGGIDPAHRREPDDKNYVVRGTAIWKPTSEFDARVKINLTHDREEDAGKEQMVSCPDGTGPVFGVQFLGNGEDCKADRVIRVIDMDPTVFKGADGRPVPNGGVPFTDITQHYGTVELNYRPRPDLTITSDTGYYHVDADSMINASFSTSAGAGIEADNEFSRRDVTEEVRINSDFATPVNFTAGAFFQDAVVDNRTRILSNPTLPIPLPAELVDGAHHMTIRSYSGFGQVRWKVISPLEVALGARWTHEERTDAAQSFFPLVGPTPLSVPEISSDNLSPELTITYKPTDDVTVFGSLKKGFKSGSFDITNYATPGSNPSFGDEKAKGGEVGVKSRWFNRRLAANLAFYDYRYEGLQVGVSQSVESGGIPFVHTLNAGSALVYGVDFDTSYQPEFVDGLELHGSVEWNHARFKNLHGVPCWGGQTVAEGCNESPNPTTGAFTATNMDGYPLQRAPDWQASAGFSWETSIGNDMSIVLANDSQFSSSYLTVLGPNRPDFFQPHFLKTNASLTLRGPKDRWEFALIANNIGDTLSRDNCAAFNYQGSLYGGEVTGATKPPFVGPAGVDEVSCFLSRGREVWLRVTYKPFS
jgi:iron complex outermembrane receptor protein